MTHTEAKEGAGKNWIRTYGIVAAIYIIATLVTDAYVMGDTPGYTQSILAYQHGGSFGWDNPFWEFGHLVWRPLGYVAFRLLRPITARVVGTDERLQVTLALMWITWLAGLVAVLLLRRLLALFNRTSWVCDLIVTGFVLANAFLDYSQTGSSYVPGLMLVLLGLVLLAHVREPEGKEGKTRLLVASAALAGSVCCWFPYVLIIPAALALPIVMRRRSRGMYRAPVFAAFATVFFLGLAYGAVLVHLRIFNLASLKIWMSAAGHGYNQSGFLRMIFGLARSFINMGQDGILFKRYLLHDPYSPVSLLELFRVSLWKLGFFYLMVAFLLLIALRTPFGRRGLLLLGLAAGPVFVFALFIFEGGMPERYLPLFPFFFLALAVTLNDEKLQRPLKYVTVVFVAVLLVSNVGAMSKPELQRKQDTVARRIAELQPRLKPNSLVAVVHLQDELSEFYFNYPFNPINRYGHLEVYSVLEPGAARIQTWQQDFAGKVRGVWSSGGDVWISKRFLQTTPRPEWNWVEGDDRHISWASLPPFFKQFETADQVGGDDGFLLLSQTPANEKIIFGQAPRLTAGD